MSVADVHDLTLAVWRLPVVVQYHPELNCGKLPQHMLNE